tara:strand:+ start:189 stop:563 length:375 start_codon:yes stop_codon:yes gene_type:complete
MTECVFCNIETKRIIKTFDYFFVIRDMYPVTDLHSLIIPTRHVSSYFDLTDQELTELPRVIVDIKDSLLEIDRKISGFNIGINDGKDAGQTIFHCHIHLIPRRKNDVSSPRGGVRGVIPDKQSY